MSPALPTRISLLASVALLSVASCRGAPPTSRGGPDVPVVLISLDTLRADRLGAYGYDARAVSPHIDALAADGIVFARHMSSAPWTPPAQMSLFTSLSPSAHGVTSSFRELRQQQTENRVARLHDTRLTLAGALRSHGYATAAFTGGMTLDPRLGFDRGFDVYETDMFKMQEGNYAPMEGWIGEHADGPSFLFWHTFEVHAPYLGSEFLGEVVPAPRLPGVVDAIRRYEGRLLKGTVGPAFFSRVLHELDIYRRDASEALYCGAIVRADAWVGRLVERLRRDGIYDRALLILTSDHGEQFGEDSPDVFYDAHGHSLREELLRVPLIVKLPNQRHAGTRVMALTRAIDVMPTVLDVVGIAVPGELEGRSLRPAWEKPDAFAPLPGFGESLQEEHEEKCVRAGRFKYLVRIDADEVARHGRSQLPEPASGRWLFDLESDPGEKRDLLQGENAPPGLERALDLILREHYGAMELRPAETEMDDETVERLRRLGYVDED